MDDSGVLRLSGLITDFSIWDDTIHLTVLKFHTQYNVYPNILLASDITYRKIDLYAQMHPERLLDPDGEETIETSSHPYNGLSYFTTDDYELELCLDFDLGEGSFTLVFDETPEFDGEPVPAPVKEHEGVWEYRKAG
jgi:hypothetical protein